jgi:hypothetical protein
MNRPTDLPGPPIRVRAARNPWAAYEAAKRDLDRERPELTPQQRDAALRAIAKRLGV